jgi:hypothetical protein
MAGWPFFMPQIGCMPYSPETAFFLAMNFSKRQARVFLLGELIFFDVVGLPAAHHVLGKMRVKHSKQWPFRAKAGPNVGLGIAATAAAVVGDCPVENPCTASATLLIRPRGCPERAILW